jgi:polar amino acid transport system substrate-binding protein
MWNAARARDVTRAAEGEDSMVQFRSLLVALALVLVLAPGWLQRAVAADSKCEPSQVATKYPSLAGKVLKISFTASDPPYSYRDPKDFNNIVGFLPDYARAVLACIGLPPPTFVSADWSGLVASVTSGQVDVMWDALYYTPERAKMVDYVIYFSAASGVFVPKGNPKHVHSIKDLCGLSGVAPMGTIEIQKLNSANEQCQAAHKPAVTVITSKDNPDGAQLVRAGRADCFLGEATTAIYGTDDYDRAFIFQSDIRVGLATPKGATPLESAIFEAIKILKADGTEKKLFARYNMDPALSLPAEIVSK